MEAAAITRVTDQTKCVRHPLWNPQTHNTAVGSCDRVIYAPAGGTRTRGAGPDGAGLRAAKTCKLGGSRPEDWSVPMRAERARGQVNSRSLQKHSEPDAGTKESVQEALGG